MKQIYIPICSVTRKCQFYTPILYLFFMVSWYRQEISNREKEGQLDEGFLSEVNAQLRQVCVIFYIVD